MTPILSLPAPREVVGVAFCYKWRILLAFTLPVAIAVVSAFLVKPIYSAESEVLVRPGHEYTPPSDTGPGTAQPPEVTMQEMIDNEIAILTSSNLLRLIVQQVGATKLYPDLTKATSAAPPSDLEKSATERLAKDLRVAPVKLSDVISISLRNPDRDLAVSALTRILATFQDMHLEAFSRDHRSSVLAQQVDSDMAELEKLDRERAAYMTEEGLFSFGEQRTSLIQQRMRDEDELLKSGLDRSKLTQQIDYLTTALAKEPEVITISSGDQTATEVANAQQRVDALQEKKQGLLTRYPENSLLIQPTLSQLAAAEADLARVRRPTSKSQSETHGPNPIATALKQQLYLARSDLAPLDTRITGMQRAIAEDDQRLAAISDQEVKLADFDRRIAELSQTTNTLRQRLVDARFLEELDKAGIASLKIIQQPVAYKPVFPNKMMFALGGAVVGIMSGLFALLLVLTTGNRFLMIETAERVLGLQLAVALPAIPRRQLKMLTAGSAAGH